MAMATMVPRYTAAEVRAFPDDGLRYEVVRGALFVSPAPGTHHQRMVVELVRRFQDYLERHSLGEALPAPYEVEFTDDSATQPDVLVILDSRRAGLTEERFLGAPSLVIEIISYSSKRTDRLEKRLLYQEEGVPEYWVVDIAARHVERWRPTTATPEVITGALTWQPRSELPALCIDLPALFERVRR